MVAHSGSSGGEETAVVSCLLCNSENQEGFVAEINVHFSGLQNLDNPGVLFFPRLLVCLDCGFSRFSTPKNELTLLSRGIPTSEAFNRSAEC
jgi:hypothetical protein